MISVEGQINVSIDDVCEKERGSVYRTSSKRLNLMVPGKLVSKSVRCARLFEKALQRIS